MIRKNRSSLPPRISVIMPTHNRAEYIAQAVESVIAQDYPNWELIVVDDGSTDATPSVMEKFPLPNIRYLRQERQGPAAARNAAIEKARGALIAFLDSDDYFLPGKLSAQARLLLSRPWLGAVHSGWQRVDESGNPLGIIEPWKSAPKLNLKTWLMWKPVFLGGIMIRADKLRKAGEFNPRLYQTDDVEMMFRLAAAGCRMQWLKQPTVCYRQHSANITRDGNQQAEDLLAAVESFFTLDRLSSSVRKLEPLICDYTLRWIAFDLWRKDCLAAMVNYLERIIPIAGLSGEQLAVTWHSLLIQRGMEYRIEEKKSAALEETLCRIPLPGNPDPDRIRRILHWLYVIWWAYPRGERPKPDEIAVLLAGFTPREITKILQTAILAAPNRDSVNRITDFWSDLLKIGTVPATHRWEVTTLYLTVFSQSVFWRDFRVAVEALTRAIREGASFRALPAWGRFLQAAGEYFLSPKRQKSNRIAAAKKRIL